jgi:HEAT repeat protein
MALNDDVQESKKAVDQIRINFKNLPDKDKEQAWNDLLVLTKDEDSDVRRRAASALGLAFLHLTDKVQATKDLLILTEDKDSSVRRRAASALGQAFQHVTNKEQATKKLLELTKDKNSSMRRRAASALGSAFQHLTDNGQATKDLLVLTKDKNSSVRRRAAYALGSAFQHLIDKGQATKDLLQLTKDKNSSVRRGAAYALGPAFQHLTDKEQATKDLLELTKDEDRTVRWHAADTLGPAFQHLTDKEQAMKDLLVLTKDEDSDVRRRAASALGLAFLHLTDKGQATKDLLVLTKDKDSSVRRRAASALGTAFQHVTNKGQATKDLLVLTKDEDSDVRWRAASALGFVFQYLTDKEQATKDLLILTEDKDSSVRRGAASALGYVFQYLTDKEQAMKDLLALTKDKDSNVRVSANYSLGKISIYKATEAESEDGLKKEMDKAIGYFEKSSQESKFINPAKFCLPFYRSYNAVISRREDAEEEIAKNLEEAKQAVAGSESKEKLLKAVENLANALQEAQKLRDLDEIQADLNAYRRYCNRAEELLDETEDKAPGAAKLMRAEALCEQTQSTSFEDLGKEANRAGKELIMVKDPIGLEKAINNFQIVLADICHRMPEEERSGACELLEIAKAEQYLEDKIDLTNMILSKVSSQISDKQKSGIREELVVSVGGTVFGTGVQHNITIPLQEIAYVDLKNDLKTIGNKDVFDLATLPPKLAKKVNQYIDKIKGKR